MLNVCRGGGALLGCRVKGFALGVVSMLQGLKQLGSREGCRVVEIQTTRH